ncbi:hypothetical protein VC03_05675 [Sneathia vaginalis]|uniref:RloB domain-containing protein n=1 Tax=Sneathia vaginalis TaxID=187101 RepID=A0A0E3ZD17_9FUSO|nr:hypothetical protein [Sneathia vaginalis]AKC95962.1 hypothetical protein VC03_05675 [Sneathia vaginalis]
MAVKPNIKFNKYKICIICEGLEEKKYLERLIELKVWNKIYDFILVDSKGNGNISSRYQYWYNISRYDIVLVFCDADKDYENIKKKINEIHNRANDVIIFSYPCTMQIVIKHWTDKNIKTSIKKENSKLIEKCTGVKNYEGNKNQINGMMLKITKENYDKMKIRLGQFTNFQEFIKKFEGSNVKWINKINES